MAQSTTLDDLPEEIISLARALVRKCRAPGRYTLEFTITSHKFKIDEAVIAKIEPLHVLKTRKQPKH